jgi:hypothetical protein
MTPLTAQPLQESFGLPCFGVAEPALEDQGLVQHGPGCFRSLLQEKAAAYEKPRFGRTPQDWQSAAEARCCASRALSSAACAAC